MSFLARMKSTIARLFLAGLTALRRALLAAEPFPEDAAERESGVFQTRHIRS